MMFFGSMSRPTLSRLSTVSAVATFLQPKGGVLRISEGFAGFFGV